MWIIGDVEDGLLTIWKKEKTMEIDIQHSTKAFFMFVIANSNPDSRFFENNKRGTNCIQQQTSVLQQSSNIQY